MPDVMSAVEITGERQARVTNRPMPRIDRDYVMLKVMAAPMCNEYIAYTSGTYLERNRPDSLGHEMAGEVVQAPAGPVRPGDRVVALCGYPCGQCEQCKLGYYSHCSQPDDPREVCNSASGECGFAQYAVKPGWMLEPIPDGLSYEHAAMACCGLGPTFGAMERLGVNAGSTILVTGLGAVGLGGIVNAKARGCYVIGAARSGYRAELARKLGCDYVVGPASTRWQRRPAAAARTMCSSAPVSLFTTGWRWTRSPAWEVSRSSPNPDALTSRSMKTSSSAE